MTDTDNENWKESAVYRDPSASIESRLEDLLSRMTPEEKIEQLTSIWVYEIMDGDTFSPAKGDAKMEKGIGQITRIGGATTLEPDDVAKLGNVIQKHLVEQTRLGIPALIHEECCSGLMMRNATLFPQAIGVAATWSPDLAESMGDTIRRQARAIGAHQTLAPVLDVTRDPRWGRTEETMGEDPYLVAKMGTAYIKGLQGKDWSEGVIATGKHFVGYGCGEGGKNWAPTLIPERELREIYLFPFEAAIKEGSLASVMNSYAEIDGIPCAVNPWLLTGILRNDWGFEGIVVSDYFAINMVKEYHTIASDRTDAASQTLSAGIDVELPTRQCYSPDFIKEIEKSQQLQKALDSSVRRHLRLKFLLGLFENPYVSDNKAANHFDTSKDRSLAKEIAAKSLVLLKNDQNLLPLAKTTKKIALIGPNGDDARNMMGDYAYPVHIEALKQMLNSDPFGTPMPEKVKDFDATEGIITIREALSSAFSEETEIIHVKGCNVLDDDRSGFDEAISAAQEADIAICVLGDKAGLVIGCTSGEATDRSEITLPGVQEELLKAIHATGTPVVLILTSARPTALQWEVENISAIMVAWLPGEEGGPAVAEAIVGDVNPGGKLPISFPRSVGQIPVFYNHKPSGGRSHWHGDYADLSAQPLFHFGHGLSYTKFEYGSLKANRHQLLMGESINIGVEVKNIGEMIGEEVVQLYIHTKFRSVTRPVQELKGFKRITLLPGETKSVSFTLTTDQFAFYDRKMQLVVEPGPLEIQIGSSSSDIRQQMAVEIVGNRQMVLQRSNYFSGSS